MATLFERVQQEQGRLDLLVNAVWGGNELPSLQVCPMGGVAHAGMACRGCVVPFCKQRGMHSARRWRPGWCASRAAGRIATAVQYLAGHVLQYRDGPPLVPACLDAGRLGPAILGAG